jgi:hypothetical protein
MKLAFLDESGKSGDAISVVAGIIVDVYRVHSTRREWLDLLKTFSDLAKTPIREFHMRNAYNGRAEWRKAGPNNRHEATSTILRWLKDKGHQVTFSASTKSGFEAAASPMASDLQSRWTAESFHVALAINKAHQGMGGNKGKSILVFDEGSGFERHLSQLLVSPPAWSDTYYDRKPRQPQLDEIMDTSFFADSTHAPLIQVADALAFILRRYADIRDASSPERYEGEIKTLTDWISIVSPNLQQSSHRYRKTGRCTCAQFFWDIAPPSLRAL